MKTIVRRWCQAALITVVVVGCAQGDRASTVKDPPALSQSQSQSHEATSEAAIAAGHSVHGEFFNEGPRQAAYLFPGTGAVHLPITSGKRDAQAFFDQGLGQLHGFWYFEAERSFRQAAAIDPTCAMAYWGMAQANINNEKRARGFIAEAMGRRSQVTTLERQHIEASSAFYDETSKANKKKRREAYLTALNAIMTEFPQELETKALAVCYRWEFRGEVKLKDADYAASNKLLDDIFAVVPLHPAHHFRIHLWDEKDAKNALTSAAQCGQSAPGIAHMWHMPGHIYSKLKRFDDAAWQQEAAARVDHARMMKDRVLPDQIHNYAHNNEWLCRDLVLIGRMSDALDLGHNMASLPRHPEYNTLNKGSSQYAVKRLYDIHYQFELWDAMIAWTDQLANDPSLDEQATVELQRARGVAFAHLKQTEGLATTIATLEARLLELEKQQANAGQVAFDGAGKAAVASAGSTAKQGADATRSAKPDEKESDEKKADDKESATGEIKDVAKAEDKDGLEDGTKPTNDLSTKDESTKDESAKDEGAKDDNEKNEKEAAKDAAKDVAKDAEGTGDKKPATEKKAAPAAKKSPAELAKEKARKEYEKRITSTKAALAELRALNSLAAGPSDEAKALLASCAKEVPPLRLARYHVSAGDNEQALVVARKATAEKSGDHSVLSLALLAHILFSTDHMEEARTTFAQLRAECSQADLTAPPFARLAPLATACGAPTDWRAPASEKTDVGVRPALDMLGPFRWKPSSALPWSLPDANGKSHSLSDYSGKPVVVIFYLGYGCVHCAEQLAAFRPLTQAYKEAGIELIGISTDTMADLSRSLATEKGQHEFPFPLVADPNKTIFKTYRAFDDFEKIPLHGTFLIDAQGLVRWQDISFKPFMDAKFLLQEAKRLLMTKKSS